MREETTLQRLRQILSQIPDVFIDADDILPEHRLRESLGLDSLAMIDLMVTVEDEFKIYFNPVEADLDKVFETVGSLADFIDAQVQKT